MSKTSMTTSLARWSATHPWRALLVWVLFVAAAVGVSSVIATEEISDADFRKLVDPRPARRHSGTRGPRGAREHRGGGRGGG